MRRQAKRAVRVVATACLVLAVAACSTVTGLLRGGQVIGPSGEMVPLNPSGGQVIASGRVVGTDGQPVRDGVVFVTLMASNDEMAGG